jgi:hypothetical protein
VILPSLAGTQQGELGDLSEISAKGYESMGDDGRGKIDELFEEGLALGSAGVAGSFFSALYLVRSGWGKPVINMLISPFVGQGWTKP